MRKTITESDAAALRRELLAHPNALNILLLTIMETGMRGKEAAALRIRDFDLGVLYDASGAQEYQGIVTIRRGAKGSAPGSYPLTPELSKLVAEFVVGLKARFNPKFVDVHGGYPMRELSALKALRRRLSEACSVIGITPITSLHVFRHRVAERLFRSTQGNIILVQRILRHKSLNSTQHYLKSFDFEAATSALFKINTGS